MAKPTDELPGVSPGDKEKKDATQLIDSHPKSADNSESETIEENSYKEEIPPIQSAPEAELISSEENAPN